jgi:hypothetical protein
MFLIAQGGPASFFDVRHGVRIRRTENSDGRLLSSGIKANQFMITLIRRLPYIL